MWVSSQVGFVSVCVIMLSVKRVVLELGPLLPVPICLCLCLRQLSRGIRTVVGLPVSISIWVP